MTDIKVTHKDLQLSTQGRGFYILDDITLLHQIKVDSAAKPMLFAPRDGIRTVMPGGGGDAIAHYPPSPTYPRLGAWIDYYLPADATEEITIEIMDTKGKLIKTFSSKAVPAPTRPTEDEGGDDEGGGFRLRGGPAKLEKTAGMHRFVWDLRYPGPWLSVAMPEAPNGPMAVPGRYMATLTVGSFTSTQSFNVVEDPRITNDGVTTADLQEQFDQTMKARDLVSEANKAVARIRVARTKLTSDPARLAKLNEIALHMITPAIRYSKPELQTHIQYLYTMTSATDQKIGRDAIERYAVLKKELDQRNAELKALLGDQYADLGTMLFPGDVTARVDDDDNE